MQMTKEEISGIVGTALFAVLLLLILLFSFFTVLPQPDELEGIPVMFGSVEDAFGTVESPYQEVIPEPIHEPEIPEHAPEPPLITQTDEPTIDVAAKREEERRRRELEAERRREEEARKKREEEERRQREINQAVSGLFGEAVSDRGETEGSGSQGVSTGSGSTGAASGSGGIGTYDLGGRSLGRGGLAQPGYTVNDYGTVVVNITVDPQGNVIHAEVGRGTTTPNSALRQEAVRAAQRTKFNSITSVNNQLGTITYNFSLK